MSTDYGIGCVTCSAGKDRNVGDEYDNCRDVEALAKVCEAAPAIVAAHYALGTVPMGTLEIRVYMGEHVYNSGLVDFLVEHEGHELRPIDEYGCWWDQCHRWVRCGACVTNLRCALKHGHAGECATEVRP